MSQGDSQEVSNFVLYIIMAVMLFVGAFDVILSKLLVEARDSEGAKFAHPYLMTVHLFMAGMVANIIYWIYTRVQIKKYGSMSNTPEMIEAVKQGKKIHTSIFWLILPAFCLFVSVPLVNIGLILTNASVYQMLRGNIILFTSFSSIIFLKNRLHRHHWVSLAIIISGVVLVGLSSILKSSKGDNKVLGIICIILSQVFVTAYLIIQEKIFRTRFMHPLKFVGVLSFWGFLMSLIMVVVLQFIPCSGAQ